MRHGLDRASYEAYIAAVGGDNEQFIRQMLDYPKATTAVSGELSQRHYRCDVPQLEYLIQQGVVSPARRGRLRKWSQADIDIVADYCEAKGEFNSCGHALAHFHIDALQDMRAFLYACDEHELYSADGFERVISPAAPGGQCEISYYLLDESEPEERYETANHQ